MRIAINTRFLIKDKLEGIGIYTHELSKNLVQLLPEHDFYFLFDRPFSSDFIFGNNVQPLVVSPPARHPFLWYWWFEYSIPKVFQQNKIDVFFSPDGFCSLSTNIKQILTIHDIGFERFPEHTPFLVRNYYRHFTAKYCHKAQRIFTVSKFTKQEISTVYNIPSNKIEVAYNAFENTSNSSSKNVHQIDSRLSSQIPYFIFVGAVHPRKNVLGLLKAFEYFKSNFSQQHQLVIVGRKAWLNKNVEDFYQKMRFKNDVVWIEQIQREDLIHLTQQSFAMVYPSWYEGFGIPVLEAMQLGVPVIASNTTSLPEITGDAALLISPNETIEIAMAMQRLIEDKMLRNQLIEKGKKQAQQFIWKTSAMKIANALTQF